MAKPPMFQGNYILNLRSIFCGNPAQHAQILRFAQDFLKQNNPGIFVVGGTNLTGKTTLINKIKNEGGLTEYNPLRNAKNPPPEQCWTKLLTEFSDFSGKLKVITPEDFFDDDNGNPSIILQTLNKGIKTIFLPEIWAGHIQALELIRDQLVRRYDCKVIVDAVSSGKGTGFFDGEANNHFIQEKMSEVFEPWELRLYLLDFKRETLQEGVRLLAGRVDNNGFITDISLFSTEQKKILEEARRTNNLEYALANMLGLPFTGDVERR